MCIFVRFASVRRFKQISTAYVSWSMKYYILNTPTYLSHLELSIGSIQIVVITSYIGISDVGIKWFNCINLFILLRLQRKLKRTYRRVLETADVGVFVVPTYLAHLELSIGSIQIVIITSYVVISDVGIKWFDCINLFILLRLQRKPKRTYRRVLETADVRVLWSDVVVGNRRIHIKLPTLDWRPLPFHIRTPGIEPGSPHTPALSRPHMERPLLNVAFYIRKAGLSNKTITKINFLMSHVFSYLC